LRKFGYGWKGDISEILSITGSKRQVNGTSSIPVDLTIAQVSRSFKQVDLLSKSIFVRLEFR